VLVLEVLSDPVSPPFVGAGRQGSRNEEVVCGRVGWRQRKSNQAACCCLLAKSYGRHHVESCGGRRISLSLHVELLQLEVVPDGVERGQRLGTLDEGLHVVVLLAQHMKLEHEVVIRQLIA
jgi:hypothetical protein